MLGGTICWSKLAARVLRWEISLDELRAEVQERQKNLDWNMIMQFDDQLKANRENNAK